jgi:superfamily II DNA or RNA helicase
LAQNAPYARISSGEIDARIYLPDSEIGYYRGARFDWAGVVCQLEFRGHSYFGQWFKTYGPEIHDAIMGPVEAFDPLGYEDKTEKVFTKIGIGQLERLDTLGYRFSKPYKIVDHGEWTVKLNSGAVEFTQTLGGRYSYEYKKTIRLNNNKMIIEHLLKNTGEKTIDTKVFDHNFFVIDNDQVGPGYLVKFPFEIKGGSAGLKEFAEVDGNKIRFIKPLGKNDHPSLRSITGYGPLAKDYDIIITSYGTMRNDIAELKNYEFQYVVLDESQSIKNPGAQVTKACNLLHSKNRLVLSGTPVQNNTFDLYAQMHFLNPGFLGGMNFFRNHYAIPIDKYRDENAIAELKKMTEPFILRRTKEKVAPDLPDKSEMIMWCEMGDQQKDVYDRYKHYYRNRLLNKIEENGIKKSSFEILNGLMRLRQICDSPVLIKDPEVFTTASVKIDELLREVTENSGNHKLLVFSQFTEMLSLISKRFESNGIRFNYLDGKTPPEMRIKAVNSFQNDDSVKAFLISLKAGGVGLNLTAADYVYIVDPWWNPAVESQAIDRTHRIGQTRKVFAYKMICKGTIEEKILELQKKKKSLSEDLIGEESSFVSKLTKDDIAFLFE